MSVVAVVVDATGVLGHVLADGFVGDDIGEDIDDVGEDGETMILISDFFTGESTL